MLVPAVLHWTSSGASLALQILQGLLTPVIAGIAVYIAWQQWRTNERKLAITAAGPISPSKEAAEVTGTGTIAIATTMGIAATGLTRGRWSRVHRMTCTGTIAQRTRAVVCN
jgi:hypothetical protein